MPTGTRCPRPGVYVYAGGAALTFLVLVTERGRDFWVAERHGRVRR
ncbi:hypothetical protein [Micromonospora sp. DT233]